MDLVRVERLEDAERASLFVAPGLVNLDAEQRPSMVKGFVDAMVGFTFVSDRGFERPQQADGASVLASGQIQTPGAQFARKDVDVVGLDTVRLECPHRCGDIRLAVHQAGHPVDEREQMKARVRIAVDSGHGRPLYTNSQPQHTDFFVALFCAVHRPSPASHRWR